MKSTSLTCLGMGEAMRVTSIVAMMVEGPDGRTTLERLMRQPAAQVFDLWAHVLRFFLGQKDRALQLARR